MSTCINPTGLYTIAYTDETWLNTAHTPAKEWHDKDGKCRSGIPQGKGGRLIILDTGTKEGFIPGASKVFTSNKTSDYHEEMNGWFAVLA